MPRFPRNRFALLDCRALVAMAILACCASCEQSPASRPSAISSLKEKTDTELLEFVSWTGSEKSRVSDENEGDQAKPSPLDRLWEMDPKEAALVLVTDHVGQKGKGIVFEIGDPNAKPPPAGEVGFRWLSGSSYRAPEQGVTILKYDSYSSKLLISEVEIVGPHSEEEIEKAVMDTDEHPIYRAVAQQTYEIIWWLRHVRFQKQPDSFSSAEFSSNDDFGRFWMKPDGPAIDRVIFTEPCGHCIDANKDPDAYASFARLLIERVRQRSGIKRRYPVPTVGKQPPPDSDEGFVTVQAPPDLGDKAAVAKYIERLCAILKNPDLIDLYDDAMGRLVPVSDPLRFREKKIDDALLDVLHRSIAAKTATLSPPDDEPLDPNLTDTEKEKQRAAIQERREKARRERRKLENFSYSAYWITINLAMHDAVGCFDELFNLGKEKTIPLLPAVMIASRHPEFRARIVEHLKNSPSLEEIWRGDLRELLPELEKMAGSADYRLFYKFSPEQEKAHQAAVVIATWNEPDKLTKTKLDILLSAHLSSVYFIPEVLRKEFSELSKDEQLKIRSFVTWLRTVDVPWSNWSQRYIEDIFTPHTPRPGIPRER
jgi:hypothetical protein